MASVIVKRSPRRPAPEIPSGEVIVNAPPQLPPAPASRWQQLVQVVPMLTGTIATALLFAGRDGGTYSYVIGAIFGFSTLGMLVTSAGLGAPKKAEMIAARREYLRHLAELRRRVRDTITRQRIGLHYRHPDPQSLWSSVDSFRLWERRPTDGDFGVVRVAIGPQTLATPLIAPATRPLEDLEPMTAEALRRFLDAYSVVPGLPIAVSFKSFSRVYCLSVRDARDGFDPGPAGEADPARGLARAVLAQLAVFHAPEDLLIAVCAGPDRRAWWEWTKWLPHALHPTGTDALGPVRLFGETAKELEERLDDLLRSRGRFDGEPDGQRRVTPYIVVVLDGADLAGSAHLGTDGGIEGVTLIDLDRDPPRLLDRSALVLDTAGGRLTTISAESDGPGPPPPIGRADTLEPAEAEAVARRLAPLRLAAPATEGRPEAPVREPGADFPELLGLGDPEALDVARLWAPRPHRDRLRIAIGTGPLGQPVDLDLKESAEDGMGPHGLLIGATGSGKSELLRTIVLGLAATHSSETLNFVLIDYKGGATFARMDRLPHVAAFISNLSSELLLVDRMTDSITGELIRRQELLRSAGDYDSVRDYERARAGGAPLAPLPSLLIVCDEFTELLQAKPDFIDLFVQIGRVGRSLGIHLLLASQRFEEGRLRGLDTHLAYRIGLRTFTSLESRAVLGVADAYELPKKPGGHGLIRIGVEPVIRFRGAYVGGPWRRAGRSAPAGAGAGRPRVRRYGTAYVPVPSPTPVDPAASGAPEPPEGGTLLDIVVDQLAGHGVPAHQIWLPPLGATASLDDLLGPIAVHPSRGLAVTLPQLHGALHVPVALIDNPLQQRRDVLWLRLDGAQGHIAVVGGPRSGKSVALRTLVATLALTHTPAEIQVYCLDFGGGQLAGLRDLPHVGGVAGRLDVDAVRRTVGEVATLLADRERRFATAGIENVADYRQRRATGNTRNPVSADSTDGAGGMGGALSSVGAGSAVSNSAMGGNGGTTGAGGGARGAGEVDDGWGDVFLVIDGWPSLRRDYEELEPVLLDIAARGLAYGIHVVVSASRWMDLRAGFRDLLGARIELRLGDPSDSLVSRKAAASVPSEAPGRGITADGLQLLMVRPQVSSSDPAELVTAIAAAWPGASARPVRLLPASVPYSAIADDADPANLLALTIGIAESNLGPVRIDFGSEPHLLAFGTTECGKSTLLRGLATAISTRFTPQEARIVLIDYRRSLLGAVRSEHLIGYGTGAEQAADLIASVADYMQRRLPGPEVTEDQLRARSWWTGPQCFVLVDDYDLVPTATGNPLTPLLPYLAQARDIGLHLIVTRHSGGAGRALFEPILQRLKELASPILLLSGDREENLGLGTVRFSALPPGRARLITRKEKGTLIQIANRPPA
ncbi:type VII secretion protein EccCa [Dactylosporangium matsuzakiense]|uniref:type VII secretion protein EccCa n=1 Tax=Dactylosporangium matsuzakiense TaxID=53360 RepID=UPI0021C38AC3|nr:type VII secretion protein EccCa [Dactylosporangium matsuzakiense]